MDEFPPDKANKDGRKGRCRFCINKATQRRGGTYKYLKARRERLTKEFGFGAGLIWRYGVKLLLALFAKFNYQCRDCGAKSRLTVHHIDGKGRHYWEKTKQKMNNDLGNLALLCRRCHGRIDGRKGGKPKKK